jgi:hypothetical protein
MLKKLGFSCDCFPMALEMLTNISNRNLCRRNRLKASIADIYFLLTKLDLYDVIIVSDTVGIIGRHEILKPLTALKRPLLHYEVFAYQGSDYWVSKFG